MAVQFGTIVNGQTVSSAFTLAATERTLVLGVSSHAPLAWFLAFQPAPGAPFLRYVEDSNANSGTVFTAGAGGWGVCTFPPTQAVRVEAAAAVSATTSFAIVEHLR